MHGSYSIADGVTGDWRVDGRPGQDPFVILAHGAGAPFTSEFMESLAQDLVANSIAVLRFHFPYMFDRQQTGKKRPPDRAHRLVSAWRSVVDVAVAEFSVSSIVVAGKSMGGRMASLMLAEEPPPTVKAAVYLGYPLHPPGKPDRLRKDHLPAIQVPQLFMSGTRDALATESLLDEVVGGLDDQASIYWVPGGDHSFDLLKRPSTPESRDAVRREWFDALVEFVRQHAHSHGMG